MEAERTTVREFDRPRRSTRCWMGRRPGKAMTEKRIIPDGDPVERVHRSFRTYLVTFAALSWFLTALGIVIAMTSDPAAAAMALGCGAWAVLFTAALIHWEKTKP